MTLPDVSIGALTLGGRALWMASMVGAILIISGISVFLSRRQVLITRWVTWAIIVPVVGIPLWLGYPTTVALAIIISLQAIREFSMLTDLPKPETFILLALSVAYPFIAWQAPSSMTIAPLLVLVCAFPSLLRGDTHRGITVAALTGFGSIWIPWSLAHLVVVWHDAFMIAFAAAGADVAAWCGGQGLKRFSWARRSLSPLSPNKTWGGFVGTLLGAALILALIGDFHVGVVLAVGIGAVAGDLLESMLKRGVGVKDAGSWLPGFGGLLDRVDSLLLVLPLVAYEGMW
ncbi:phosphatidate cytidylyltransferase [Actinomyces vulturis]|uniref:phosphatidate cytidylyltransferase n=1 Tax=Actinomyces vulturis TaxID=1857645 RepID=UPI000834445A|nr:phosphatidate cytidylyltransferase [Actinomyces vulturis]